MSRSVVSVAVLLSGLYGCGEVSKTHYNDVSEIVADRAIERGWFPEWFPKGATDIDEIHDLDTNAQGISFRLDATEYDDMLRGCFQIDGAPRPRYRTQRFPSDIASFDLFHCGPFFTIRDGETVHMWRNSAE